MDTKSMEVNLMGDLCWISDTAGELDSQYERFEEAQKRIDLKARKIPDDFDLDHLSATANDLAYAAEELKRYAEHIEEAAENLEMARAGCVCADCAWYRNDGCEQLEERSRATQCDNYKSLEDFDAENKEAEKLWEELKNE